jgi:hypothetical protein
MATVLPARPLVEPLERGAEISGIWTARADFAVFDLCRVEHLTWDRNRITGRTIVAVTEDRVAEMSQRNTDLVQEPRLGTHLEQCGSCVDAERTPAQLTDPYSARPIALGVRYDPHPSRAVARRDQPEFETAFAFDFADNDGAVALFDPVLPKRGTQALPDVFARREQHGAGGVYVQAMHDPAPQTRFPNTVNFWEPGDQHIQHGVGLVCSERMNRSSSGLVDGEPTRTAAEHHERAIRLLDRAFVFAPRERGNLDDGAGLEVPAFGIFGNVAPCDADSAARKQAANLGPRQPQMLGEETVEPLPAILLSNGQRVRGIGHRTSLVGPVATGQSELTARPVAGVGIWTRNPAVGDRGCARLDPG